MSATHEPRAVRPTRGPRTGCPTGSPTTGLVTRAADSADSTTYVVKVLGVSHPIRVAGSRDERLSAIASRQRGRAARYQMRAAGISDDSVDRLAARGRLIRRHRAVYAVGHAAPVDLGAETEALLACGEGAVLSHLTSARLWGILRREPENEPIHVTVCGRHGGAPDGVLVHRTSTLAAHDIRDHHGLPITSAARALLDIAERLTQDELDWAVDEAIQLRLVTSGILRRVAAAARGRRGAGKLAAAAARHRGSGITRSEAEKRLRALVRESGLPEPRFNVRLYGYLFDAYWPELGLVVEIDSEQWHSIRPKVEHDAAKGAAAVAAGLILIRFTAAQLKDAPVRVMARLAQAITRAEARAA